MSYEASAWAMRAIGISSSEKLVLLVLADHVNVDDVDVCWPGIQRLCRSACLEERAVRRALRALEDHGLIRTEGRARKDGSRTSNRYFLNFTPPTNSTGGGVLKTGGGDLNAGDGVSETGGHKSICSSESVIEPETEQGPNSLFKNPEEYGYSKARQVGTKKQKPRRNSYTPRVPRQPSVAERIQRHRPAVEILGGKASLPYVWLRGVQSILGYEVRRQTEAAEALADLKPDKALLDVMWADLKIRTKRWGAEMEKSYWPGLDRYVRERQWETPLKEVLPV